MDDLLLFEDDQQHSKPTGLPWKVLVVDDEEDVHAVTCLALSAFEFDDREIILLHAYSGEEAKKALAGDEEIALILLDVVMETDQAGLDVVKYVREDLNNHAVRIVLRTGQPGQAPEKRLIRDYDINDYKNKTELTSSKLFTLMYSSLRSYRDIIAVTQSKRGLEKLIVATRGISATPMLQQFVEQTLQQLTLLLNLEDKNSFVYHSDVYKLSRSAVEVFVHETGKPALEPVNLDELESDKQQLLKEALSTRSNIYRDSCFVLYCSIKNYTLLFYIEVEYGLTELDSQLLDIFAESLSSLLENMRLSELINDSQREMIFRLGEVVESRSNETGYHVKRVAHYSALLAELVGLSADEVTLIEYASPLHDIGKIAIPDAILNKPGKLDAQEWEIMKTHAEKGHRILKGSDMMVLDISSIIALTHHEKWDGSGYPYGLAKDDIHVYGRITALADVFDALGSERCYKEAWELDDILALLKEQRGKHFDPRLIDLFMQNLDRFLAIRERFKEPV